MEKLEAALVICGRKHRKAFRTREFCFRLLNSDTNLDAANDRIRSVATLGQLDTVRLHLQ